MTVINPFDFFLEPQAEQFPFEYAEAQRRELAPYLATEPLTKLLKAYLDGIAKAIGMDDRHIRFRQLIRNTDRACPRLEIILHLA